MKREGNEETVSNLITWLHQEASIRSRGKANTNTVERNEIRRDKSPKKQKITPLTARILAIKHVKKMTKKDEMVFTRCKGIYRHLKVCHVQKTTEKASQPAHGTDSKPKSSSWLPGILKHCYGHVWASTDQARPQNSERGTSDHLRLHDITCDSS